MLLPTYQSAGLEVQAGRCKLPDFFSGAIKLKIVRWRSGRWKPFLSCFFSGRITFRQQGSHKGSNFESLSIRAICAPMGPNKARTTPYHPQGNGQTERTNRSLLTILKTVVDNSNNDIWDDLVPRALSTYRSTVHESTGCTPVLMIFGQELRLPFDVTLLQGRGPKGASVRAQNMKGLCQPVGQTTRGKRRPEEEIREPITILRVGGSTGVQDKGIKTECVHAKGWQKERREPCPNQNTCLLLTKALYNDALIARALGCVVLGVLEE